MGGDGYALCLRAGAPLIDMEFVQFFPIGHLAPRLIGMDPIMWDPFRYKLGGRLLNRDMEEFTDRYGVPEDGKYVITRDRRHLRHPEGGRGRPRLAAWRRLSQLPALPGGEAARGVRPGDRSAGGERHRPHQDAGRGRADRALPHGRRRGRRAHGDRSAGPAGRRRSGRRRQRRQPAVRQRHHRGAGVRPRRPGAAPPSARKAMRAGAAPRRRARDARPDRAATRRRTRPTPPRWCRRCSRPWPTTSGRCARRRRSSARSARIDELDAMLGERPFGDGRRSTCSGSTGSTCATCCWWRAP